MPGMQVLHCYHGLPLSQRGNVAATPGDRILPRIHLTIHLRRDTRVLGIASEPDQHRGCVCVCGVACVTIVAAIRGLNRYSVEKDLLASDQASTRITKSDMLVKQKFTHDDKVWIEGH